ncbi:replication initiator protein [Apis mellifera associated microvirus 23]|nr:replication initiator protein [Apis mellifera associated microvirus 23]
MRCTSPRTVGFKSDGRTIAWSQKHFSKEFATFELPCGQCLECRLEYARQWAVRCIHEAKMYEDNSFITLTYDDDHLKSPKLQYRDFQLFVMRLRSKIRADVRASIGKANWCLLTEKEKKVEYEKRSIGIFVTGEYGDKNKRPHWHALLFNWRPRDCEYKYSNDRGDKVFSSKTLDALWPYGLAELGSVTFESAGYCARYAAKKLSHGRDDEHDYHPISKKSSKHAIGKKFLEKFWPDIFNHGYIILQDGNKCSIPRYYEKWLSKHYPTEYSRYVTQVKQDKIEEASEKSQRQQRLMDEQLASRGYKPRAFSRNDARRKIIESKFKLLQSKQKL